MESTRDLGKYMAFTLREMNFVQLFIFAAGKTRVIYFNAASNNEGKNTGAMYYLINRFIEDNAEKNLILDLKDL